MARRACDLLLVSLALPPLFQHGVSFVLAELLPFRGPGALAAIGTAMLLSHLLLATPLALAALPGSWLLVRSLPGTPTAVARPVRALAALFALLTALVVAARFSPLLPFQPLQEVAGAVRLALGLGCTLALLAASGLAPRWLLRATALAFVVALISHTWAAFFDQLDPELLLGARSIAAVLFGSALLLARRPRADLGAAVPPGASPPPVPPLRPGTLRCESGNSVVTTTTAGPG